MLILRLTFVVSLLVVTAGSYRVITVGCKENDSATNDTTPDTLTDQKGYCRSLDDAVTNLTSNTMINVTADAALSLVIKLRDLANISIIGHNSPTVKCSNDSGWGLHFLSCHNCSIENIVWSECGSINAGLYANSVIQFDKSSDVKIQNCSFKSSVSQGVALLETIGDVVISHCNFVKNRFYSVIYYTSSEARHVHNNSVFMINNCKFSHNEAVSGIVYAGPSVVNLTLRNSSFHENQGYSVLYISNYLWCGDI